MAQWPAPELDPVAESDLTTHEALTTEAHNLAALLDAKASAGDLVQEIGDRTTAVAAEAATRAGADSSEVTARASADAAHAADPAAHQALFDAKVGLATIGGDPARVKHTFTASPEAEINVLEYVLIEDVTGHQIRVLQVGPTGTLWASDQATQTRLFKRPAGTLNAASEIATGGEGWTEVWRSGANETPDSNYYSSINAVLELASGHVLIFGRSHGDLIWRVLRSNESTLTTNPLTFAVALTLDDSHRWILNNQSWFQVTPALAAGALTSGHIYYAENNDDTGPNDCHVYRSTDDGASFSARSTISGSRHIHTIQADPYQPGRIFVHCGDNKGPLGASKWGWSDDGGATWTWAVQSDGTSDDRWQKACLVGMVFTTDYLYFGSDTPNPGGPLLGGAIFRLKRTDLGPDCQDKIERVRDTERDCHIRMPHYCGGAVLMPGCVVSQNEPNDHTRLFASFDGKNFNDTSWRWKRRKNGDSAVFSTMANIPGTTDQFWMFVQELAEDPLYLTNGFSSFRCQVTARQPGDAKPSSTRDQRKLKVGKGTHAFPTNRTFSGPISSTVPFIVPLFNCVDSGYALSDPALTVRQPIDADPTAYWQIELCAFTNGKRLHTLATWTTDTLALSPNVGVKQPGAAVNAQHAPKGADIVMRAWTLGAGIPQDLSYPVFSAAFAPVNNWSF